MNSTCLVCPLRGHLACCQRKLLRSASAVVKCFCISDRSFKLPDIIHLYVCCRPSPAQGKGNNKRKRRQSLSTTEVRRPNVTCIIPATCTSRSCVCASTSFDDTSHMQARCHPHTSTHTSIGKYLLLKRSCIMWSAQAWEVQRLVSASVSWRSDALFIRACMHLHMHTCGPAPVTPGWRLSLNCFHVLTNRFLPATTCSLPKNLSQKMEANRKAVTTSMVAKTPMMECPTRT